MSQAGEAVSGARRCFVSMALFGFALAIRLLPWPTVFLADGVQPFGTDAFYHLRRIAYSVAHFPALLEFDPYLNFPEGARPIWTPILDGTIAGIARLFGTHPASISMEGLALCVPPILGASTVVVLYRLALRHFAPEVAWLSALVLCVLSGHYWYSQVGFLDHHCAVALVAAILLATTLDFLEAPDARRGPVWPLALAIAAGLLIWPGMLLHVGISVGGLAVFAVTRPAREQAVRAACRLGLTFLAAFAAVLPLCWGNTWERWGAWSPVVLSGFQPWLLGTLAIVTGSCAVLWRRFAGSARSSRARAGSGAAIAMVCLAASALAIPGLGEGAIDVWQWFGRDERFQALVSESQPLFWLRDRFTLEVAAGRLSNFVFVAPLAWIAAGLAWRRKANPAPRFFFLAWVAALLIATLVQKRFFNSSSVGLALLFGWSLAAVGRWLAARPAWRERPGPRRLVLAGLAAALLWPTVAGYRQPLENWLRDGDALMGSANQIEQRVAIEMARYLEATSEPTSGWLDSRARPEYAVLAPWPLGHVLEYVARRPTVTDAFGDDIGVENFESALRYYASSESDALSIADRLSVRYVVAQRSHAFLGQRPAPDSILAAMFGRDGSEGRTAPHALRALARHRLVYESAPLGRRAAELESVFKLYEIVPGAVLIGRTTPRAWVRARLELATNRKRSFVYATRVRADADGVYRLRVPYANEGQPGFFELGAEYFVSCGGEEAGVVVTEDDVQAGRSVASPELACAARPAVA